MSGKGNCKTDFECPLFYLVRISGDPKCEKGAKRTCFDGNVWRKNIQLCCIRDTKVINFMKGCERANGNLVLRQRKDLKEWTSAEKTKFREAYQKMARTAMHASDGEAFNIWHDMVAFHQHAGRKHGAPAVHTGDAGYEESFLPWHRYFLFEFETNLQYYADDCSLTLPFTRRHILHREERAHVFTPELYGALRAGPVREGIGRVLAYNGVRLERQPDAELVAQLEDKEFRNDPRETFARFSLRLEAGIRESDVNHNNLHGAVDGAMGQYHSPADPVFFLHHCWVDYQWWKWQQNARQALSCGGCTSEGLFDIEMFVNVFKTPGKIDVAGGGISFLYKLEYLKPGQSKTVLKSPSSTSAEKKAEVKTQKKPTKKPTEKVEVTRKLTKKPTKKPTQKLVYNDSCEFAKDDSCDDPGLCAKGTDCTDCGNCPAKSKEILNPKPKPVKEDTTLKKADAPDKSTDDSYDSYDPKKLNDKLDSYADEGYGNLDSIFQKAHAVGDGGKLQVAALPAEGAISYEGHVAGLFILAALFMIALHFVLKKIPKQRDKQEEVPDEPLLHGRVAIIY